jgi:hypothetical protein
MRPIVLDAYGRPVILRDDATNKNFTVDTDDPRMPPVPGIITEENDDIFLITLPDPPQALLGPHEPPIHLSQVEERPSEHDRQERARRALRRLQDPSPSQSFLTGDQVRIFLNGLKSRDVM